MPVINRRQLLLGSLSLPLLALPSAGRAQAQASRASFESLLRPTVHAGSERWELGQRMSHYGVPGIAVAILRDRQVVSSKGYGSRLAGQDFPVGADTLFSVGSVSKVATAALCLKLVALGKLDLDQGVGRWLRGWHIPVGPEGDSSVITLRMLLSHTAGFNVHGFKDVEPSAPLPSLLQTLNGTPPALNKPLQRIDRAGSRSRYSGGGYMVVQAVIEDAMGQAFDTLARRYLFVPLGMTVAGSMRPPRPPRKISPTLMTVPANPRRFRVDGRVFRNWRPPGFGVPPTISRGWSKRSAPAIASLAVFCRNRWRWT